MTTPETQKSFLQDLWDRRFFQFVGSYLAVSFGILQFGQFVEKRYELDFMLVEKMLIVLVIFLPAFIVFIYNHGRPGDEKWLPYEKLMVPGSLAAGLIAAVFLFNTPISAATKTVTITDDAGSETTRVVPTINSSNRLVVFPFMSQDNQGEEWRNVAGAFLLDKDLEQDMRVFSTQPLSLKYYYESYNQEYLSDIPFATQLKIARDLYTDFFVIAETEEDYAWSVSLFGSENGEKMFTDQGQGESFYEMIDQISTSISNDLYPAESGMSIDRVDLPVSNLVTQNEEALQFYVQGNLLRIRDVSMAPQAISLLQKSTELDPSCAECYAFLARLQRESGKISEAKQAIDQGVALGGSLPERQQFMITSIKYQLDEENNKLITLFENWRKLYPSDYNPYERLIAYYDISYQFDKAKEVGEDALANGHRGNLLKTLADLYTKTEEYEKAQSHLEKFAALYPHKSKERVLLGDLYIAQGQFEKAMKLYEDIGILNPNDIENIKKRGNIKERQGEFTQAMKLYEEALAKSNQVQDSMGVYVAMESYYERLGRYSKSREISAKREALFLKLAPAVAVRQNMFFTTDIKLLLCGKEKEYTENMEALKAQLPEANYFIECLGGFLRDIFTDNLEGLKEMEDACLDLLIKSVGESWTALIDGAIARLEGKNEEAMSHYERYIEETGAAAKAFSFQLSEVYRKAGAIDKADELMDKLLVEDPSQAILLAEKAQVAFARKNVNEANQFLEKALEIWENADKEFVFYQEALKLKKQLSPM